MIPATVRWSQQNGMGVQFGLMGVQETHVPSSRVLAPERWLTSERQRSQKLTSAANCVVSICAEVTSAVMSRAQALVMVSE